LEVSGAVRLIYRSLGVKGLAVVLVACVEIELFIAVVILQHMP